MTTLAEKIRTRGYWRFVLRPADFDPERVAYAELEHLLRRAAVSLRGWDFPHFNREGLVRGQDFVGSETDWDHHVESWRFYQSGQLVFLGGMKLDWADQSSWGAPEWIPTDHPLLGVVESLWTLTEAFELAARLSTTKAGSDSLVIEVEAGCLKGRELFVDDQRRGALLHSHIATLDTFTKQHELDRDELLADVDGAARAAARDLFARFGWSAPDESLQSGQAELRRL